MFVLAVALRVGAAHPAARLAALTVLIGAQSYAAELPRFEDYPAREVFAGKSPDPKLVSPIEKRYATQIRNGVNSGYGVFRDGKEQKGPNFAGNVIVVQWPCGAPCLRMAMVDSRTGYVYYPPISINGIGAQSFDLPVLRFSESVGQNPGAAVSA